MRAAFRKGGILVVAGLVPWLACAKKHSGGSPPAETVSSAIAVQVSPPSASVALGSVQTFVVTVSGGQDETLVWSVNGIPGGNSTVGTIQPTSSGADYTPLTLPSPNPVLVTATVQGASPVSGSSTVTVEYANDTSTAQSLPISMGTSGGNASDFTKAGATITCCSGTLGCLVKRNGAFFILSNNHVLDDSGQGVLGDPVTQPGLTDNRCVAGTLVATLSQAAPLQTSNVDAALALIVSGAVDMSGSILDLGPAGKTTIAAAPPSATLADPESVLVAGGRVSKSGRSTGLTCGTLLSINTDVSVDYSKSCAGPTAFTVDFHNQLLIDGAPFSAAGDSGSLIVASDTARPLGLLFAGNGGSSIANPMADVLGALKDATTGELPAIVGDVDHPVSCAPVFSIPSTKSEAKSATAPTPLEFTRASNARDHLGALLLRDPSVQGLGIGTSADNPAEGAILIYLRGIPTTPLPHQLEGVRTRIVRPQETAGTPKEGLRLEGLAQATRIKAHHAARLFAKSGVIGVGVGRSLDSENDPSILIFIERDKAVMGMDVEIEGIRTRIIEGERFRSFGWGKVRITGTGCCGGH